MITAVSARAGALLRLPSAHEKAAGIAELQEDMAGGTARWDHDSAEPEMIGSPGQPAGLRLVDPREVGKRKLSTAAGKACFLHAVAHIEFNAINLALDAAYRFRDLPEQFYIDWIGVASDEARHHSLIVKRMQELGFDYGDFPAHNGLWDIARRTTDSLLGRMALVPCVLEARGLDVTPAMVARLQQVGEARGAEVLGLILEEEVGHVAIGVRWFHHACQQQSVEPIPCFISLVRQHLPGRRQGPFNHARRLQAGFTEEWMAALATL